MNVHENRCSIQTLTAQLFRPYTHTSIHLSLAIHSTQLFQKVKYNLRNIQRKIVQRRRIKQKKRSKKEDEKDKIDTKHEDEICEREQQQKRTTIKLNFTCELKV